MSLLEDMQKTVRKLWKLRVPKGPGRSQTEGQSWQIDLDSLTDLAAGKFHSITQKNHEYIQGRITELEPFLSRMCTLGYLLRLHCTPYDVHIAVKNDERRGCPRVKIWMPHTIPPQNLEKFLDRAVYLAVPTLDYGSTDLPKDISITWELRNELAASAETAEIIKREHRSGGIPGYSGEFDLWGCLEYFPKGTLDLGWFREEGEGEPADSGLIQYYGQPRRSATI